MRLQAAGSRVLVTADCGALTVRSDGERFQVEGFTESERYER